MTKSVGKRSNKANATIQKIREASLKRIIKFGESGISMTEICREVGVSRPTIYRYFPTREALLESVFELILDDYIDKLNVKIALDPDPLHRVDVIADFAVARLQDGGAQLFHLDPALMVKMITQAQNRLTAQSLDVFSPLFDMSEALSGNKIDRHSAATAYLLFSTAFVFFGTRSSEINTGKLLRQMIRSLAQFH